MLMLVNSICKNCGKLFVSVLFLLIFVTGHSSFISAQDAFPEPDSELAFVQCGPSDQQTFSAAVDSLPTGDLFIKTNGLDLTTQVSLYLENYETGSCDLVGTVTANDKSWTRVGRIATEINEPVSIVVASPLLGADAYASVASVMSADPSICVPDKVCLSTFQGYPATLEPVIISSPGDLVTVQEVVPAEGKQIRYVEYYDGGKFLYTTSEIEEVDRRYLRGGNRDVSKIVFFTDATKVTINETVAMPADPLYSQYIASTFYRLSNQVKVLLLMFMGGLLIYGVFYSIRRFHARRTFRTGHGIDDYLRTHND